MCQTNKISKALKVLLKILNNKYPDKRLYASELQLHTQENCESLGDCSELELINTYNSGTFQFPEIVNVYRCKTCGRIFEV